jgi:hypothetical protein
MVRAVDQAHAAVLVMAAEEDTEAAANAGAIKDVFGTCLRMVPGQDHGFALFPSEAGIMAGWLGEYLGYRAPAAARPKPAEAP